MLEDLKQTVLEANKLLPAYGLVTFTWGNVSQIDREKGIVAIKPSGVPYDELKLDDIVLTDLDGNIVEGDLNPSSDLETHLEFYRNWSNIGGVVHTHSQWATSFAQAGLDLKALGTTHADYFYGAVPCTRKMTDEEIQGDYELETGKVIVEEFKTRGIGPDGPFVWGKDAKKAVENSVVLEEVAKMNATATLLQNNQIDSMQQVLLDKHFKRKHGPNAYYGQGK